MNEKELKLPLSLSETASDLLKVKPPENRYQARVGRKRGGDEEASV